MINWPEQEQIDLGLPEQPDAILMYDGGDTVHVPYGMAHRERDEKQLVGTDLEVFAELAGRVCYDSLGKGKPSNEYHAHIAEIKHFNIYEGCVRTFLVETDEPLFATSCLNRPGVTVLPTSNGIRVTMNVRAALEWERNTTWDGPHNKVLGWKLRELWHNMMPQVVSRFDTSTLKRYDVKVSVVQPVSDEEKWVSLWLLMNRGGSHEQVRHRYQCHVSQRSTRYCDENDGHRIKHPFTREYEEDTGRMLGAVDCEGQEFSVAGATSQAYQEASVELTAWMKEKHPEIKGVSRTKQVRGVCREYLEHQLSTQMVFGASLAAWKWMIHERGSVYADGHIRELYSGPVQRELDKSRYAWREQSSTKAR